MAAILSRDAAFSLEEPALATAWILKVPFVSGDITVVAERLTITSQKVPAQARFSQGSNRYFPGINDIDGLSITFYETESFKVTEWLKQWRRLIVHKDGSYGLPAEYKKQMHVFFYSRKDNSIAYQETYEGVWPTDKNPIELNYEDETGRITIDAQFSVDSNPT